MKSNISGKPPKNAPFQSWTEFSNLYNLYAFKIELLSCLVQKVISPYPILYR